jgi:hypothetical protein
MTIILFAAVAVSLIHGFVIRPLLSAQPVLSQAFKSQTGWLQQLHAKLIGWRTRIAARLTVIAGVLVGIYDQALPLVMGQDWTPLTSRFPGWMLPVGLVGIGLLFGWLRALTDRGAQIVTQSDDTGARKVVALIGPVR